MYNDTVSVCCISSPLGKYIPINSVPNIIPPVRPLNLLADMGTVPVNPVCLCRVCVYKITKQSLRVHPVKDRSGSVVITDGQYIEGKIITTVINTLLHT